MVEVEAAVGGPGERAGKSRRLPQWKGIPGGVPRWGAGRAMGDPGMLEGGKYRGWTLCVYPTNIWVPVMSQCGASEVQRPGRGAVVGSGKNLPVS